VKQTSKSRAVFAATALLASLVVVACGRNGGTEATNQAASPARNTSSATQAAATPVPTVAAESPEPSAEPSLSAEPAASSGTAAAATLDPLGPLLTDLDAAISGINASLSGSDTAGGE
jgi:hypothetical protein